MGSVILEVEDLRRIVEDRVVIEQLSFNVRSGDVLFVHGAKGAGKSLLLRSLACLDEIQGGNLLLEGKPPDEVGIAAWRAQVLFVGQTPAPLKGTPSESYFAIQRFASQRGRSRGDLPALVSDLGLEQTALNRPWAELTEEEAGLVQLAIAIALRPQVLLVDDPTAGCAHVEDAYRVEHVLKSCGSALVWVTADVRQPARVGGRVLSLPLGTQTTVLPGGQTLPQQGGQLPDPRRAVPVPRPVRAHDESAGLYSPASELLSPRTAYSDAPSHFGDGGSVADSELQEFGAALAGSLAAVASSHAREGATLGGGGTSGGLGSSSGGAAATAGLGTNVGGGVGSGVATPAGGEQLHLSLPQGVSSGLKRL